MLLLGRPKAQRRGFDMFKFLVRLLYLPLFLIGGNGLALFIVEAGYSKLWLAALVIAFIAIAVLLERAVPYDLAFNQL